LAAQNGLQYYPFQENDVLLLKLVINPAPNQNTLVNDSSKVIAPRSYRVRLVLTDSLTNPPVASDELYIAPLPSITFSGSSLAASSFTQNGFTVWAFTTTGSYTFTMSNFIGKTIYMCVVGGGASGQHGFAASTVAAWGGSGGSGGQTLVGSYRITSNATLTCTAVVGLGGIPSYYGNGINDTPPGGASYNTSGTLYGSQTTNDATNTGVCCSGGYSSLLCSSEWGTVQALGGTAADPSSVGASSTCPTTAGSNLSVNPLTLYVGKSGGTGVYGNGAGGNGIDGTSVSVANVDIVFGSSGGGSQLDRAGQSTAGVNAGNASGSNGSYRGWTASSLYDGFPGADNCGGGGGGGSGSGGSPYASSDTSSDRQAGGAGGSGVVYIWY
jgi:hypothetical protein